MKKKTLILAGLVIGLLLPSCSNNSNDMMSSVIEKGLKRSIEQSEFMAASLMDQPDSCLLYTSPSPRDTR